MGASNSKEKEAAALAASGAAAMKQREEEARKSDEAFESLKQKFDEAYQEGRMEGFTAGRLSGETEYYETLLFIAYGCIVAWSTTVFAMYVRNENRVQKLSKAFEEKSKTTEAQLVIYRTAEQRVLDAEKALEDLRARLSAQQTSLRQAKKSLHRERRARGAVMKKYSFSKRQLQAAYGSQQRLTAELASTRMACGIAAVGGLAILLVTFGKQLMEHGHGGGHTAAVEPDAHYRSPPAVPPAIPIVPVAVAPTPAEDATTGGH